MTTGAIAALASRTLADRRPVHALVHGANAGVVALVAGSHEAVRDRFDVDLAEHALRRTIADLRAPGLDALAAIVRAVDAEVSAWPTETDRLDLWMWGVAVAIVAIDGPVARVAQAGAITTAVVGRSGPVIAIHDDLLRSRMILPSTFAGDVTHALDRVVLQGLGHGSLRRVSLAELHLERGDRIVLTTREATPGLEALTARHVGSAAELADVVVDRASSLDSEARPIDRACAAIEIVSVGDGPYR